MVQAGLFSECPSFPTLHPCGNDGYVINRSTLHWQIPSDVLETLTAKHLTCSRNVLDADKAVIVRLPGILEWRANQP